MCGQYLDGKQVKLAKMESKFFFKKKIKLKIYFTELLKILQTKGDTVEEPYLKF